MSSPRSTVTALTLDGIGRRRVASVSSRISKVRAMGQGGTDGRAGVPGDGGWLTERVVIDALPRALVLSEPSGRILLWNTAAEQLFGWSEAEVLGRSVVDVLAPAADVDANRSDLAFVASGNSKSGDRVVVRRDGTTVRIATMTRPVLDPAGTVVAILGSSEDVTELRLAERHARDVSEHFRSALEAGGLGTWRWDRQTGRTLWDERLEALFGLPPGGFDGTFDTYTSLLHPDDRDDVLRVVNDAVDAKTTYRVEHRVVWPDGSIHWIVGVGGVTVDEDGVVTGTVGCSMDITSRIAQELELQRLARAAVEAAEQERLQRERLEFLGAINDALQASHTLHDVMVNVTRSTVPRLGDWCSIHVLPFSGEPIPMVEIAHTDPDMVAFALRLQARFPYDPDGATGVPRVIRTGETEFYPEITPAVVADLGVDDERRDVIAQLALRSAIAVPLRKRGRVLGALQFVMSASSRRYTPDDVALAESVAARIASSVENLRLHEQQRAIANTLQRSLLPAALPDVPGIDIAVRYWPSGEANEVGGDFYDIFAVEHDSKWGVVIGDVCGRGIAAAALTGLARHSIRDSAWHGDSPTQVLTSLHRAVRNSATDSFLTAVYATLDARGDTVELNIASGGHPLPVHVSKGIVTAVGATGPLIGVFDCERTEQQTVRLGPGDAVVFYTDGATDAPPPHQLDHDQFMSLVAEVAAPGATSEGIADGIHRALEAILPFEQRDDDIALLVLVVQEL
jgi:PAS domain S-box-containing protein